MRLKGYHDIEEQMELNSRLDKLEQERKQCTSMSVYSPFVYNLLSLVFTVINVLLPIYIMLEVFVSLVRKLVRPSINDGLYNFLLFEEATQSTLGSLGSLVEMCAIIYCMTSAVVGFYQIPIIARIRPQLWNTPMHRIVINLAFIQLLSSSFPIQARILGITSFDLLGYYHLSDYLSSDIFQCCVKIVFLAVMSTQYFNVFPPTYWVYKFATSKLFMLLLFVKRTLQSKPKTKSS